MAQHVRLPIPKTATNGLETDKQIHSIALVAKTKFDRAADAADHDLRLLVGHANFLDGLTDALLDIASHEIEGSGLRSHEREFRLLQDHSDESDSDGESSDDEENSKDDQLEPEPTEHQDDCLDRDSEKYLPEVQLVRFTPGLRSSEKCAMDHMPKMRRFKPLKLLERIDEETSTENIPYLTLPPADILPDDDMSASAHVDFVSLSEFDLAQVEPSIAVHMSA